ncbi:hypothetical protein HZS_6580 [Henneguya salminicola]|nr:hypothetical protein HZS_6580 [Henneguya salminicola]
MLLKINNFIGINDSTLYSSLLTDSSFTHIKLEHDQINFQFYTIEVGPEIIVGVSNGKNLVAISTNFGRDWKISSAPFNGVNEIAISPRNSRHIAIVSDKNKVALPQWRK